MRVFSVPFDAGSPATRMGAGPEALLAAGLVERLEPIAGHVDVVRVTPAGAWHAELQTTFELHDRLSRLVGLAVEEGAAPLVLAGDCNMTVAALAAHGPASRTGVIWLDAHADLNTPETDVSGYLDGQGLAMLTGRCWAAHMRSLRGFEPVPDERVLLVGARAIDELERDVLDASSIATMSVAEAADPATRDPILAAFMTGLEQVHVHVDVDVLDTSAGIANSYAVPGGMLLDDVLGLIGRVARSRPVVSGTIASWDPSLDARMPAVVTSIAVALASALVTREGS